MFPVAVGASVAWLLVYALAAIAAGVLTGLLASFLLGLPRSGILEDGALGMVGFLLLSLALTFVPALGDALGVRFVAPRTGALIFAPALPLLREILRLLRYWISSAAVSRRLQRLRSQ